MDLEKTILAVAADYAKTGSVKKTAANMGLSSGTVRKMLVTAGGWGNKTVVEIAALRRKHPEWDNKRIAAELNISQKTVQLYTPYESMSSLADSHCLTEENNHEIVDRGECGDRAEWTLTKSGTLTVSGSGPMMDYAGSCYGVWGNPRPRWWMRRDGIQPKRLVVEEGITALGEYAFCTIPLERIELPESLLEIKGACFLGENRVKKIVLPPKIEVISWDAFYSNVLLEEIRIPASVGMIQTYAFHACMSLRRMYFEGDAPRVMNTAFDICPEGAVTVYHREGTKGWEDVMWNGYATEVWKTRI